MLTSTILETQETISIPVAYVEVFVMMLGAFIIGYVGATFYERLKSKKEKVKTEEDIVILKQEIQELKEENEHQNRKLIYRKDRMDQEYEQVNFQKRAFSDEVLTQKTDAISPKIDFDRIGYASFEIKDDLQKITGIGPYTEKKLNDLGIYTFNQISNFSDEDIIAVTKLIKFFPDRIKNDRWVSKAEQLQFDASQKSDTDNDLKKKVTKVN